MLFIQNFVSVVFCPLALQLQVVTVSQNDVKLIYCVFRELQLCQLHVIVMPGQRETLSSINYGR